MARSSPSFANVGFITTANPQAIEVLTSCKGKMDKTVLVILAEGAEEIETVTTIDMLRRGGLWVTVAGLEGAEPVLCSRGVVILPDKSLVDALAEKPLYDCVVLPGGISGTERLCKSGTVGTILRAHEKQSRLIAAICAAPLALVTHGIATGKRLTSYPSVKDKISSKYEYVEGERVVVDEFLITSRGPGTAYWFGLKLIELLAGKEKAAAVERGMAMNSP